MANLYFYTHPKNAFESWDFRNPDLYGIGNSETSQIEMARRLAARGHRVVNYAPVPEDCPGIDRGVIWKHSDSATFKEPGVWILYRCPKAIDNFLPRRPDQEVWLVCQDEDYEWTPEQEERVDWVIGLCKAHVEALEARHKRFRGKVRRSSNGCKAELVREVLAENRERNPKRLVYASSPDRALEPLLKAFARAREFDPELELHVAYGFNNIDKVVRDNLSVPEEKRTIGAKNWLKWIADLKRDLQGEGIVHHGRLSQPALYRLHATCGIWCYPNSRFRETSCATAAEMQAMGCVPIISRLWAVGENVGYGIAVEGDPYSEPLALCTFAAEIVRMANAPDVQEEIRQKMMPWAMYTFDWEVFANQWHRWILASGKIAVTADLLEKAAKLAA